MTGEVGVNNDSERRRASKQVINRGDERDAIVWEKARERERKRERHQRASGGGVQPVAGPLQAGQVKEGGR